MKEAQHAKLHSTGLADKLIILLKALFVLIGISAIFSLFQLVTPGFYDSSLVIIDGIAAIITLVVVIVAFIMGMRWIYVVHQDLREQSKDYPLTPVKALMRFLIPLYNIWGVQNVLLKMHDHFKYGKGKLGAFDMDLKKLTTLVYCGWIASIAVTRVAASSTDPSGSAPAYLYLISAAVDAVFYFAAFQIVLVVKNNLSSKAE